MFRRNTGPEISNIKLGFAAAFDCADLDFFISRSIFQSVVYEIGEHLMNRFFVGNNFKVTRLGDLNYHSPVSGYFVERSLRLSQQFTGRNRALLQTVFARLYAR